jgi:hypothetical protein
MIQLAVNIMYIDRFGLDQPVRISRVMKTLAVTMMDCVDMTCKVGEVTIPVHPTEQWLCECVSPTKLLDSYPDGTPPDSVTDIAGDILKKIFAGGSYFTMRQKKFIGN